MKDPSIGEPLFLSICLTPGPWGGPGHRPGNCQLTDKRTFLRLKPQGFRKHRSALGAHPDPAVWGRRSKHMDVLLSSMANHGLSEDLNFHQNLGRISEGLAEVST